MSSIVTFNNDAAGWNSSLIVGTGTNALVFIGLGENDGTPSLNTISSDQDGAPDFSGLLVNGASVLGYAVWFNATAATHVISTTVTDITRTDSAYMEVSGLDSGATAIEDFDNTQTSSGTSHATGSATLTSDGLLVAGSYSAIDFGIPTFKGTWTEIYDGGKGQIQARALSAGATDDGDWTGTASVTLGEHFIIAFMGATPDGGGPVTSRTLTSTFAVTDGSPINA